MNCKLQIVNETCDAMLRQSANHSLKQIEQRAGEECLISHGTLLNIVHEEVSWFSVKSKRTALGLANIVHGSADRLTANVSSTIGINS